MFIDYYMFSFRTNVLFLRATQNRRQNYCFFLKYANIFDYFSFLLPKISTNAPISSLEASVYFFVCHQRDDNFAVSRSAVLR